MKRTSRNKGNITYKPLCDCIECTCVNCPDILKLLSISFDEPECNVTVKSKKKTISRDSRQDNRNTPNPIKKKANELDVKNDNRSKKDCVCGTIANTLISGIPNDINQDEFDNPYNKGHSSKNIK